MKRITATLYTETKVDRRRGEPIVIRDPNGFLYSGGKYRTKIKSSDLPEWYVYGVINKLDGYISARGVQHLLFVPDYIHEAHLFTFDMLFISYDDIIEPTETEGVKWYKGYKHVLYGSFIIDYLKAVVKYSGYDDSKEQMIIAQKIALSNEQN
jgi:hypothetical protein